MLKKSISIFLLFVFLCANTEAHQLLKLPLLVKHYIDHKKQNETISPIDFLVNHYVLADDGDGNTPEDMQLPFKSDTTCNNITSIVFLPFTNFQLALKPVSTVNKFYNTYSADFISSAYLSSIWQPPKSC